MRVADFDYELPEELIAQHPLKQRDASRLLVLDKKTGAVTHRVFAEIVDCLTPQDFLVFNDTRVIPARIMCSRHQDGTGQAEVLLLRPLEDGRWEALVRPGRKLRPGAEVFFGDGGRIRMEETTDFGGRIVSFPDMDQAAAKQAIYRHGEMPLPPYIHEKLTDKERYQTVYAREEGSVAAPTAGLHFTPELLAKLKAKGVPMGFVTLHVGLGTFRPVMVENVEEHTMHAEFYRVEEELAAAINAHRARGGRVVAVGTTSVRSLESAAAPDGSLRACQGWTDIFITPGYRFKVIDALITNFHLPKSTLLMLVSALAGRERILAAYREAVQERYRFFSFGDAMFIR
ncbi:MAG TPA: tRNA preQ1(34) S-adenosylmethionine ribosyltransferase-isomerase QueA [Bacillota bacterium]|jgi:S-adenosylmethionine:tRNA ribosyltransferase-isomerase|nr:tRNA preQ1(34) S-adenosylmethionine ribosyltransferase-isomerase QueA [Bacillota bacterium]HPT67639.1 tRNA preQ1(34) S-adenosylmethionine ribosyltransferase-isomerase QueA [Bacillota bacterium]